MNNPIVDRILLEAGVAGLLDALSDRLAPTDLQSLLLEVYRRRVTRVSPRHLIDRYETDRFVRPAEIAPPLLTEFDRLAWSMLPDRYMPIELSPVCPFGTNAAIATVDQGKVVTTIRNSEVVADSTNVLALECAVRRRELLRDDSRSSERVLLCASHRLLRGQAYGSAAARAHFRLLGLCAAGRDEGSFHFEITTLRDQLCFFLRLLQNAASIGLHVSRLRIAVTDLEQGRREEALTRGVLDPLKAEFPDAQFSFDGDRAGGRGYYAGACFHVYAANAGGNECQLIDGGFTTWTQQLLASAKERLLISGLGVDVFCGRFGATLP